MSDDAADRFEDALEDRAFGRRARRGGGGGRKKSGGASSSWSGRDTQISKALSRLLRHQAQAAGVPLDREGYARLDLVLAWPPLRALNATLSDVRRAVVENDKQRFSLKAAHSGGGAQSTAADEVIDPLTIEDASALLIRANQGHSIAGVVDPEALLTPILLDPSTAAKTAADGKAKAVPVPPIVVHGTYFAFWPAIVASGGLKPMGRNHVHFATALPQNEGNGDEDASASETAAVVRGMRRDVELLVYVDVERALREVGDKMRWWISDNGVVLTAGLVEGAETGEKEEGKVPDGKGVVPLRYFKLVTGRNPDRSGVGVLWRDGEWVADLPKGLKARVPFGKGGQSGGGFGRRGGYGRGRN